MKFKCVIMNTHFIINKFQGFFESLLVLKEKIRGGCSRVALASWKESHRGRGSEPAGLHGLREVTEAKERPLEMGLVG